MDALPCFLDGNTQRIESCSLTCCSRCLDPQRNHNISYQVLREMVRSAAAEEQLMDARCPLVEKWIPVEVLAHFSGSLVEGMGAIMDSVTSDSAELREVIRKADAALASQSRSRGRSSGSAGGGGPVITPLNLKKQLYSIR